MTPSRVALAVVAALTTVALVAAEAIERRVHAHAVDRGVRWLDGLRDAARF